jgi:5-methylcytosine-specific restriction enzyme subunit McrC
MAGMRELVVSEYQTIGPLSLTAQEVAQLQTNEKKLAIGATHLPGMYTITATSWVGIVSLPSLRLRIVPKTPVDRLLFLLGYVSDPGAWRELVSTYQTDDLLLEAIAHGFAAATRSATSHGLLYGYRATEEALSTVRGRIRFADQVRLRYGIAPPVEVAYDEFTDDINENRIVRAALYRLSRIPIRSDDRRREIRTLGSLFHGVSLVDYAYAVPTVQYGRLNMHYRPAVELARLILRATSLRETGGTTQSSTFLVDMNALFEDFVALALRDSLQRPGAELVRNGRGHSVWLDIERTIALKPDLSWWVGARCVFAGDVKYKRVGTGPENADAYQALAYATALNLPVVTLIYAEGGSEFVSCEVAQVNKRIEVRSLDLTLQPDLLLKQINDIASSLIQHSWVRNPSEARAAG